MRHAGLGKSRGNAVAAAIRMHVEAPDTHGWKVETVLLCDAADPGKRAADICAEQRSTTGIEALSAAAPVGDKHLDIADAFNTAGSDETVNAVRQLLHDTGHCDVHGSRACPTAIAEALPKNPLEDRVDVFGVVAQVEQVFELGV